jgi:hypothetical protein
MTESLSRSDDELTPEDRRALDRLLGRIARNAEGLEQVRPPAAAEVTPGRVSSRRPRSMVTHSRPERLSLYTSDRRVACNEWRIGPATLREPVSDLVTVVDRATRGGFVPDVFCVPPSV